MNGHTPAGYANAALAVDPARRPPQERVLVEGRIYLMWDRFVCANGHCAGASALYTGVGIDGHRARRVVKADRDEWATYGLGPIRCECGALSMDCATGAITRKAK